MRSLWFVVVVATGCVESSAFICGDGVVCPAGYRCEEALSLCIDPAAEAACVGAGLADGEPCAVRGLPGTCTNGMCEASICGNGVLEVGEDCDGADLGAKTCLSLDYYGEEAPGLACRADCTLDTTACRGHCGDGIKNGTEEQEQCDGTDLGISPAPAGGPASCTDVGFYDAPNLRCTSFCRYDVELCTGFCGDMMKNGPAGAELCDAGLPQESCFDVGFDIGTLQCSESCGFAFGGCARIGWQFATSLQSFAGMVGAEAYHIHGSSPNEVWAVGQNGYAYRFDGSQWTQTLIGTANLKSVWVAGVGAAWASDSNGVLWRWNGSTWTADTSAPASVRGVWGTSATDVWVITNASGGSVRRWNGSSWTVVGNATDTNLIAIHGSAANDVWIATSTEVRHWDGSAWSAASSTGATTIRAIFAISPTDAWAVGSSGTNAARSHWDGSTWSASPGRVVFGEYTSVSATATNDVWMSATYGIEHFDGASWTPGLTSSPMRIAAIDPGHVFAADMSSVLLYTGLAYATNDPNPSVSSSDMIFSTDDGHILVNPTSSNSVAHFNGLRWNSTENVDTSNIRAAWGASATTLWVTTNFWTPYRFDGTNWVPGAFANGVSGFASTSNMWGSSASDIWYGGPAGKIRHFGGTSWGARDISGLGDSVEKIWGSGPNDVWALAGDRLFRWTNAWAEVPTTMVPKPLSTMVVTGPDQVILISNSGAAYHGNAAGWTMHALPTIPSVPIYLVTRGPNMVFGASPTALFHFDGTRWTQVRMPPLPGSISPSTITGLALTQNRLDVAFASGAQNQTLVRSLVITQPWRCVADETGLCTDGVDNDCDGTLDDRDTQCP